MLQNYWYMLVVITLVSLVFCLWQRFSRWKCLGVLGTAAMTLAGTLVAVSRGWLDAQSATLLYGVVVACIPVLLTPMDKVIEP